MPTTQQNINTNLNTIGLYNPSAAAVENEIAQSLAIIVDNTVSEINNSLTVINAAISSKNYGKPGYYVYWALYFQYGYSLSVNTTNDPTTGIPTLEYYYSTIDTTAQIINQAAFVSNSGGLFLKVATLNTTTNLLQQLSSLQLSSFISYYNTFQLPGLPVNIISLNANILNFTAQAFFSATYDLPTLQTNIYNALVSFRNSFQFNGTLFITQLQSYMTANVPGLISFYISGQTIDNVPFAGEISLTSGYFNYYSVLLNNPSSQITYIPQ